MPAPSDLEIAKGLNIRTLRQPPPLQQVEDEAFAAILNSAISNTESAAQKLSAVTEPVTPAAPVEAPPQSAPPTFTAAAPTTSAPLTLSSEQAATILSSLKAQGYVIQPPAQEPEVLAAVRTVEDVAMGWVTDGDAISNSFEFSKTVEASRFLTNILENCRYFHDVLSVGLSTSAQGISTVTVSLTTISSGSITTRDVALANFINYKYGLYKVSEEEEGTTTSYCDYYYGTPESEKSETSTTTKGAQKFRLQSASEILPVKGKVDIQAFAVASTSTKDPARYFAKVPVAVIGQWSHEIYGTVSFTQEDYDTMKENFTSNVLGFEPPLFLGHPRNDVTVEGAPAEGFLTELTQEGDALFGIYELVDEQTYADVKKGKFRYASAELLREFVNPATNKDVGIVLFGHALTNRPFVPNLPRVGVMEGTEPVTNDQQELSIARRQFITLSLQEQMQTTTPASTTAPAPAPTPTPVPTPVAAQALAQPVTEPAATPATEAAPAALTEAVAQSFSAQLQHTQAAGARQIEALSVQVQAQAAEILSLKQANRAKDRASAVAEVNAMCLAQEVKDIAIEKINSDALGANEESYLSMLRLTNDQMKTLALGQHGSSAQVLASVKAAAPGTPTAAAAATTAGGAGRDAMPQAYAQIIQQNEAAAKR